MCGKLHVSHQYTTNLDTVMHHSNKGAENALALKTLVQLYTYYLDACDSLTKMLSTRQCMLTSNYAQHSTLHFLCNCLKPPAVYVYTGKKSIIYIYICG